MNVLKKKMFLSVLFVYSIIRIFEIMSVINEKEQETRRSIGPYSIGPYSCINLVIQTSFDRKNIICIIKKSNLSKKNIVRNAVPLFFRVTQTRTTLKTHVTQTRTTHTYNTSKTYKTQTTTYNKYKQSYLFLSYDPL